MQLTPQHLTITKLLENRLFRIPEYQRAYSWQRKQRNDLFSDIKNASAKEQHHFMATIVALARGKKEINTYEFNEVEIVDGQQRITTLIILLKAIEKALNQENKEQKKIKADLNELFVKDDDYSMVLLQTNHDSSQIFSTYIQSGNVETTNIMSASDKNICDAISECEKQVDKWVEKNELIKILGVIKNSLSVIYHELSDEAVVYSVFEVLNSRGLDVSWLDKTKSQLMSLIFEYVDRDIQEELLHDIQETWKSIFGELGLRDKLGTEALKFAGTLAETSQPSKVLGEQDAYLSIIEMAGTEPASIKKATQWLHDVVRFVSKLEKNPRYSAVTKISHVRFLATTILTRKFDEAVEKELMARWEKMSFRVFGIGNADARNKVGEFVRLGYDIRKNALDACKITDAINNISKKSLLNEKMDNERFWDGCYDGWEQELRYILYRYEEKLASDDNEKIKSDQWEKIWQVTPSKSIEHIEPQSSGKKYIHYLGNLTMLTPGKNSSLKDKAPIKKAEAYRNQGLLHTQNIGNQIHKTKKWSRKNVMERTKLIAKFIKEEWGDEA